jgi:hypothetical protein
MLTHRTWFVSVDHEGVRESAAAGPALLGLALLAPSPCA